MVAREFISFLDTLKESENKWIAACANFLEMSYDFLEFVTAYRVGDAVAIEYGYNKHLNVWQCNGQNKYAKITFKHHAEVLSRDSPFQTIKKSCVDRYKRAVGHDDFLEHCNPFLSEFPLPRSLASFEEQSNYIGLGMATRTFSDYKSLPVYYVLETILSPLISREYNNGLGALTFNLKG